MRHGILGMAAALTLAAPGQAACWNGEEVSAATVRDLQSKLMVAALRCQVAHHDITADYNAFVRSNRAALGALNDRLKARFIRAAGPVEGQAAYDRFTTALANAYGARPSGAEVCAAAASTAREAALMAGSVEGLLLLAAREGLDPPLADGRCTATVTLAAVSEDVQR